MNNMVIASISSLVLLCAALIQSPQALAEHAKPLLEAPSPHYQTPIQNPPLSPFEKRPSLHKPPFDKPPLYNSPIEKPPLFNPPIEKPPLYKPPFYQPPLENPPFEKPPLVLPPFEKPPLFVPPFKIPPVYIAACPKFFPSYCTCY